MSFFPRKLLSGEPEAEIKNECFPFECYSSPPPPPLGSPASPNKLSEKTTILLIILCVLGGVLLFLSYFTIMRLRSSLRRARRRAVAVPEIGQDFIDENQGPIVDHPIWYIRTVGLPQSVIESISIFRFRKGDGLIEGSDCSICLSEFQDDEILRLLPKCSHAFHSQCIDEWLRSHKNCPVCRAPILSAAVNTIAIAVESRPPEENQAIIQPETDPETETDHNGETSDNTVSISIPRQDGDKSIDLNLGNLRALSDLTDHYRTAAECAEQPQVRRSSSMVNFPPGYKHLDEGCSGSSTAPAKRECKSSNFHVSFKSSSNGRRSMTTTHQ